MIITTDHIKEVIEEIEILKSNSKIAGVPGHKQSTIIFDVNRDSFIFVMDQIIEILKEF